MQEKLFNVKPVRVARPDRESIDLTSVYLKLANEIIGWSEEFSEDDLEELFDTLKEEFSADDLFFKDGYELTKEFEDNCGYEGDVELVGIMDQSRNYCYNALKEAVKKWVIDCEITAKYSVGEEVMTKVEAKIGFTEYIGKIVDIEKSTAKYVIYIEELGHVSSGQGITGRIFDFEEIESDFFDEKHWK